MKKDRSILWVYVYGEVPQPEVSVGVWLDNYLHTFKILARYSTRLEKFPRISDGSCFASNFHKELIANNFSTFNPINGNATWTD